MRAGKAWTRSERFCSADSYPAGLPIFTQAAALIWLDSRAERKVPVEFRPKCRKDSPLKDAFLTVKSGRPFRARRAVPFFGEIIE